MRRERAEGDWGGGRDGRRGEGREGRATLLPNEGSALVELKMDMQEAVTKTSYFLLSPPLVVLGV